MNGLLGSSVDNNTSGAKYKMVPHIVLRRVLSLLVVMVPKSVTIMCPDSVMRMFSGFRSR